jgi:hypothetical protein
MKRWLGLTILRAAAVLLVAGVVILVIALRPAQQSKELAKKQLEATSAAIDKLNEAEKVLKNQPLIDKVTPGQQGNFSAYAADISKGSASYHGLTLIVPGRINNVKDSSRVNDLISRIDSQETYADVTQDIYKADKLLAYQTAVCQALVQLLEYNAADDVRSFDLKSQDTQTRLNLARDGLAKAAKQLRAAQSLYSDSSLDGVLDSIASLQASRSALAKNGDTKAWVMSVSEQQQNIIKNRADFWRSASTELTSKLAADRRSLQDIQELWKKI